VKITIPKVLLALAIIAVTVVALETVLYDRLLIHPEVEVRAMLARTPSMGELQIRGGRGFGGIVLTNNESEDVTDCTVTADDRFGRAWTAHLPQLSPAQTASLRWSTFRPEGHGAPAATSPNVNHFVIRCGVGAGDEWKLADLSF